MVIQVGKPPVNDGGFTLNDSGKSMIGSCVARLDLSWYIILIQLIKPMKTASVLQQKDLLDVMMSMRKSDSATLKSALKI